MIPAEPSQEGTRALTWTRKVEAVGGFLAAMLLQHRAEGRELHPWRRPASAFPERSPRLLERKAGSSVGPQIQEEGCGFLGRWMTSVPYLSARML